MTSSQKETAELKWDVNKIQGRLTITASVKNMYEARSNLVIVNAVFFSSISL
jgi:hypothetical protein